MRISGVASARIPIFLSVSGQWWIQGGRRHVRRLTSFIIPDHRTIPESIWSYTPPEAPVCLWLTGLPAAGKTTLSEALAKVFTESGLSVELLDGDRIRAALSPQLGYSRADRHSNVVRVAHLAVEALSHRDVVIVALVSPLRRCPGRGARNCGRIRHIC